MTLRTLLGALVVLALTSVGHSEPGGRFTETVPTGIIDWTRGVVQAKGIVTPEHPAAAPEVTILEAREAAAANLLETLEALRMCADRRARHMMAASDQVRARVIEIAAAAPVVETVERPDGTAEITVEMSLLGSFAQLMLPEDIKQVEPIRPLSNAGDPADERTAAAGNRESVDAPDVFTGLVIDARGIGAKPAMAPMLMDESGKEVFGPTFISREYAVQRGVCAYVSSLDAPADHPRVAPRPLWVRGLRTQPDRSCDIVISNADAARIRGASAHLGFLRQCRVIIILD